MVQGDVLHRSARQMRVRVGGDFDGTVAEEKIIGSFGVARLPLVDQERGAAMPERVKLDPWQFGAGEDGLEFWAQVRRLDRRSEARAENEVVIAPVSASGEAFFGLARAVRSESCDHRHGQGAQARGLGLGIAEDKLLAPVPRPMRFTVWLTVSALASKLTSDHRRPRTSDSRNPSRSVMR